MIRVPRRLVQRRKSHRVVGIRDRKANSMMKPATTGGKESLQEDHRRHRGGSKCPIAVVQRLRSTSDRPRKEALMIPRTFAEILQPHYEAGQSRFKVGIHSRCAGHISCRTL